VISIWLVLYCAGLGGGLAAQESPPASSASPTIRELPFQVYLRRNEDGELVLVPDFSLEEYLRLYDKTVGGALRSRPGYSLPELSVTGEVAADQARLKVKVSILRLADSDATGSEPGWIAVPLRLGRAAVTGAPDYEGEGKKFLTYDMRQRGYVLWLKAAPDTRHSAAFSIVLPVQAGNGEGRLECAFPDAVVSRWQVSFPGRLASVGLKGASGGVLSLGAFRNGKTMTTGEGLRGETRVVWKRVAEEKNLLAGIDVDGEIRVAISGPRQVSSEADLAVRALAGGISSLQLRLPPGMTLRPSADAMFEYTISERDPERGHLVTVRPRGDRGPLSEWNLRLSCELSAQSQSAMVARWEPARFEVLGAVRHRGEIRCTVHGQWSVLAEMGPRVVRLPEQSLSFRYFAQPPELTLTVRQRLARGRVEPTHVAKVSRDRVEMHSRFHYRFAGVRPSELRILVSRWELLEVLLDGDPLPEAPVREEDGEIRVTLPADGSRTSGLELEMVFQQTIDASVRDGSSPLSFSLPRPAPPAEGTVFVAPASLELNTTTDVRLVPLAAEMRGLVLDAGEAASDERRDEGSAYTLREQGGGETATFAGAFRIHDRQVEVEEEVIVSGVDSQFEWVQYLTCRVRYQPGFRVRLGVPAAVSDEDLSRVECILRDDPEARQRWGASETRLEIVRIPSNGADVPEGWSVVEVVLPEAKLGTFLLGLRLDFSLPPADGGTKSSLRIPWWVPLNVDDTAVQRREQRLTVQVAQRPRVELPAESWSAVPLTDGVQQFVSNGPVEQGDVRLEFPAVETTETADVAVHRRWVQSWLTRTRRRDRAVWKLTSQRRELRIELPPQVQPASADVHLLIDGRVRADHRVEEGRTVSLSLSPDDLGRPLVLEMWYTFPQRPPIGRLRLVAPQVLASHGPSRSFWQIVTPFHEHLWSLDGEWAAEVEWVRWGEFLWRRAWPTQASLEQWVGASSQAHLPRGVHAYTFSSIGAPGVLELSTVRRSWLIALASGAALLLGWLLVAVPQLRHPLTLVGFAVVAVGVALMFPLMALEVAQASVVGVACFLLAWSVDWVLRRPHVPPPRVASEAPSGQSQPAAAPMGGTTLTAPVMPRESSVESLG